MVDERVLRNVETLIQRGAPAAKIDQYLLEEGVSKNAVKAAFAKRSSARETGIDTDSSFLGAIGQGATLGFSDEIMAGIRALGGQDYDKALKAERDALKRYQLENPGRALAGELAGGLATAFVPGMGGANVARTLGQQTLRAGVQGGLFGAVAGAGTAEGDLTDRAMGAARGAAFGAPLGAAAPGVMAAGRAGGSKFLDTMGMRTAAGQAQRADEKLAEALARDNVSIPQARSALDEAARQGKPLGIMDVAGENTRGLGRAAAGVPGRGKQDASLLLNERAMDAPSRISRDLQDSMGVGNDTYADLFESISQRLRTSSKPLYDAAYVAGRQIDDPEILQYLSPQGPLRNLMPKLWREAQDQAALEGDTLTSPFKITRTGTGDDLIETLEITGPVSLKHVDYIKRALDDAVAGEKGNKRRLLGNLKREMLAKLDDRFPEYKQARAAYRGDAEMREALENGRAFLNENSDLTARAIREMSDGERQAFRVGAVTAIRDKIATASDRSDIVKRIFGAPEKRAQLRAVFPSEGAFNAFAKRMEMEAKAAVTRNSLLSGSRTTPMAQEINDMGVNPSLLLDLASNPAAGIGRIAATGMLTNRLQGIRGAVAGALNDRLFNFNPAQQRGVLDQLGRTDARMQQQAASRQAVRQSVGRGLGTLPGLTLE